MRNQSIFNIVVLTVLAVMLIAAPAQANRLFGDAWRVDAGVMSCSATNGKLVLTNVTVVGGPYTNVIGGTVKGGVVTNSTIIGGTITGAAISGGTQSGTVQIGGSISNTTIYIGATAATSTNLSVILPSGATNTFKFVIVP